MSPSEQITVPDAVLHQQLGEETVILHLGTERYYGLDEVGSRAWQLLRQHRTVDPVVAALLDEYDVDEATLRRDLEDKGVVSFADGRSAGAAPLPLAGIFLLPRRADDLHEPVIRALPAAAAVPHVVAQLLTPAWLAPAIDAQRFETVADLVGDTPVRTVERPDNLAALPRLCDALLDEMERLAG